MEWHCNKCGYVGGKLKDILMILSSESILVDNKRVQGDVHMDDEPTMMKCIEEPTY